MKSEPDILKRIDDRMGGLARSPLSSGRIVDVTGLTVKARIVGVRIGEICELREPGKGAVGYAEVIGFQSELIVLSLLGDTRGVSQRTEVVVTGREPSLRVGSFLLGSVIDAYGNPLLRGPQWVEGAAAQERPLYAQPPEPLQRLAIEKPFQVKLAAVDALLTCAEGQRVGVFGGPGSGKSSFVSHLVKRASADVVVCGLVGERGREVSEFVRGLGSDGSGARVVTVASTSDRPPLERLRAAFAATTIAEHFRDQGSRVLMVMDSLTRVARALREVGLAAGEPPVRRGFPPSVFSALPRLFERAGNSARGVMTAFYTVLTEGDIDSDPIAEEARALLDGHIVLSLQLAAKGLFPAIDVLNSRSRLMGTVVGREHAQAANRLRSLLSLYQEFELLVRIGEYKPGRDAELDEAVGKRAAIEAFLHGGDRAQAFDATQAELLRLARPQ